MTRRIGILNDHRLFRREGRLYAETPFIRFLAGFHEHFDDVTLICRVFQHEPDIPAPYPATPGVRVVPLPPYPRIVDLYTRPARYWPAIRQALARTLPDLSALWLNFGHPVSLYALKLAQRRSRARCFAVLRGAYDRDARLRMEGRLAGWMAGAVVRTNMWLFARRAGRLRIPCFAYGDALVKRLERMGLEPHPMIDSLLSKQNIASSPEPDSALAVDLLFVGRLTPEKGLDLLLQVLPETRRADGAGATLRVVGSGPLEGEYRSLVERLGLADRVCFEGHVPFGPELFRRYRSSRILVMPSRTEGVPKTAFEAMAFGCPVLATSVGGLPDALGTDGSRGRLLPPEDPGALRTGIESLLADPDSLRRMSLEASKFGGQITLESQVATMVDLAGLAGQC